VVADGFGIQVFQPTYFAQLDRQSQPQKHVLTEFTLLPVGRIEGRVVAEQPELFRRMLVSIKTTNPGSHGECNGVAIVSPDADGRFLVPNIATGWLDLYARLADERVPVRPRLIGDREFEVAPARTTKLEIPLDSIRRVAGIVRVKGTDEPVLGANVAVRFGDVAQWDYAATDSAGRYSAMVLPGQVSVQIIYAGRPGLVLPLDARTATIRVPEGSSDFELPPVELIKTKAVSGRLLDQDGKPLGKFHVIGLVGNRTVGWGESNNKGEFVLESVPEDLHVERYTAHDDTSPIPKEATIDARDPLVIRLK
jgi:hypothetical protein